MKVRELLEHDFSVTFSTAPQLNKNGERILRVRVTDTRRDFHTQTDVYASEWNQKYISFTLRRMFEKLMEFRAAELKVETNGK